jgi:hydrogenase maturation factor
MAVTVDPFFVMPELGWERAAWFAVHIVASDAATSGLEPLYVAFDLNLPLQLPTLELEGLWEAVHEACANIGLSIIAGHTGRYEECAFPMVGAATVLAPGAKDSYVTASMAQLGDTVILTKGAAIETTGVLGAVFPKTIGREAGVSIAHAAEELFWRMSVVQDARVAVGVGVRDRGVTAMHDATEAGVWNALWEIANASVVGMVVEEGAVLMRDETRAVCALFGIDPFTASSEGALVITCRPAAVAELLSRLGAADVDAGVIGEIVPPNRGVTVVRGGAAHMLEPPFEDGFWPAFRRAQEMGWQ